MFKEILVPYDASEPAERALSKTIEIAKSTRGEPPNVTIIHVIEDFIIIIL